MVHIIQKNNHTQPRSKYLLGKDFDCIKLYLASLTLPETVLDLSHYIKSICLENKVSIFLAPKRVCAFFETGTKVELNSLFLSQITVYG